MMRGVEKRGGKSNVITFKCKGSGTDSNYNRLLLF